MAETWVVAGVGGSGHGRPWRTSLGPPARLLPLACHLGASEADPLPFVGSRGWPLPPEPPPGGQQEGAAGPGSEMAAGL